MTIEIRIANHEDWHLLNHLYADMNDQLPLPNDEAEKILTEITQVPNYNIYLAYLHQKAVGTFSLLYVPTMMYQGYHKFAVLEAVTVISQMRGKGIGSQMVKTALQLSAEAGCYKVTLSSNIKRDRAHKFYQSLGFAQHGWSFNCVIQPGK